MNQTVDKDTAPELDTRARVLREALRLFAEHGYEGTGMRAIAAAAGIRQSSLYHYFPGKDAIMEALIQSASETKLRSMERHPSGLSLREVLFRSGRGFLASMSRPGARALLQLILEAAQHHPEWAERYLRDLYDAPNEILARAIAAALPEDTALHVNARWIAESFIGALLSFVIHEQLLRRSVDPPTMDAFLTQHVDVVARGIAATGSTDLVSR